MEPSHVLSHRVFSRRQKNFLQPDLESSNILPQGYVDSFDLPIYQITDLPIYRFSRNNILGSPPFSEFFIKFNQKKIVILVKDEVDYICVIYDFHAVSQ